MTSLRAQLTVVGFAAIYAPVLLVLGVDLVTDEEVTTTVAGSTVVSHGGRSPWLVATVIALAPVALGLAWWWSGRATRPLDRVRAVADEIGATDLRRRIGLDRGPTEVVALAGSFDAMLDRLEEAAEVQRTLIEETSHELRTPLAVVATTADVLLAHPAPSDGDVRDGLERVRGAAGRLASTVDGLLVEARGRARALVRRPSDLVALVRSIADEVSVVAPVPISISGPETLPAPIDEDTVRRAIANLVDNAVRHAPAGTTVTIALAAADGRATVAVTDAGPGLPADAEERAFDRFWRADRSPGAGLGLPIARHVAHAHAGTLAYTPTPTTFTLALPL